MRNSNNQFFGEFGGRYTAEVLRVPLAELEEAYASALKDPDFKAQLEKGRREYIGRPTPLLHAENISGDLGGAAVYIKLEGLAQTGAHKINNALGQVLLAKRMGKKRIIAETGAGQHGVAVAAVCAKYNIPCTVYMGETDIKRQRPNVFWMELYGAEVVPVRSGSGTLKDAVNEAMRDWAGSCGDTHYLLGSALGPSPFPGMVRDFQSVIGAETAEQSGDLDVEAMIACVGGGSNAIGFFSPFIDKNKPRLIAVEAGGRGMLPGEHAVRMDGRGRTGIVQGYKSMFLTDNDGQVLPTHSVSAGLDYPGIGPQLADLGRRGRIEFTSAADNEALDAVKYFAEKEGIIPALESAHACAAAVKIAPAIGRNKALIINMSGRGEKDLFILARNLDSGNWGEFLKEEAFGYGD